MGGSSFGKNWQSFALDTLLAGFGFGFAARILRDGKFALLLT